MINVKPASSTHEVRLPYLIIDCKSDSCTSVGSLNCLFKMAFLILIVLLDVTITAPDLFILWVT